jgi:hypothetical protein
VLHKNERPSALAKEGDSSIDSGYGRLEFSQVRIIVAKEIILRIEDK